MARNDINAVVTLLDSNTGLPVAVVDGNWVTAIRTAGLSTKEIRAFGRGTANRDALCQAAEKLGLSAVASGTACEAVQDADLVVTSVSFSPKLAPFLDARWLQPGIFVTMPDQAAPWVAAGMPAFNRIVIDDLKQEAQMPKPLVDLALVAGDLTGLVNGDTPGRRGPGVSTCASVRQRLSG